MGSWAETNAGRPRSHPASHTLRRCIQSADSGDRNARIERGIELVATARARDQDIDGRRSGRKHEGEMLAAPAAQGPGPREGHAAGAHRSEGKRPVERLVLTAAIVGEDGA